MNTAVAIRASVFPNEGVTLSFEQRLEVSLDCAVCGRTRRTVIFASPGDPGRCTPTGHAFPGHIGPLSAIERGLLRREVECTFYLNYEYSPVTDRKYPQRISCYLPTWARVHFKAMCPRCDLVSDCSIQNNVVRLWTCVCKVRLPAVYRNQGIPRV